MAYQVILPKLGQTVEESTIVKWHKAEGDAVRKGDVLFEIETDKAVLEAPSFFEGTLLKILVRQGQTVPVRSVVGFIGQPGEKLPDVPPPAPAAAASAPRATAAPNAASAPPSPALAAAAAAAKALAVAPSAPARRAVSPRARRLAREKAVDPLRASGSGPDGRVTEKDVIEMLQEAGYDRLRLSPAALELARAENVDVLGVSGSGENGRIMRADVEEAVASRPKPMSRMRQTIAERLTASFTSAPHFYVTVQADVTELLALRAELKAAGKRYTVNDFIMKAAVDALVEWPLVNSVTTDGRSLSMRRTVNLGVAVALDDGLVVPVIRSAHLRGLLELHDEAARLAERARAGKLSPDEMSGGTFTVSNMGMLDVENFTAIINPGESAILAVSSARRTPVAATGGAVSVRELMKMTFSYDHRVVDGAVGAKFANAVRTRLEDTGLWRRLT